MDYQKEVLLFIATTLVATGSTLIQTDMLGGVGLMTLGGVFFIGRGFYKKYL